RATRSPSRGRRARAPCLWGHAISGARPPPSPRSRRRLRPSRGLRVRALEAIARSRLARSPAYQRPKSLPATYPKQLPDTKAASGETAQHHEGEREDPRDDHRRRAFLLPDHRRKDRIGKEVRERQHAARPWPHRDPQQRRDDDGDHGDEERDEVARELEAPRRPVRPAAVEMMEDRPHLAGDRREAAGEPHLERKAEAIHTAPKPFAASSSPPARPCKGPTEAARLLPPSFREPAVRRSTPLRRAIKYGNEIEPTT